MEGEEVEIFDDALNETVAEENVEGKGKRKKGCNPRIDELSRPQKRYILNIWQNHIYHFEPKRVEKLRELLLELFALSPEETENYFSRLRADAKKHAEYKKRKAKYHKLLTEKKHIQQRSEAYNYFKKLLTVGLLNAFEGPVHFVVSNRLRCLSDAILEQLCELKGIEKPDRDTEDREEVLLIDVADWIAIGIEHAHYDSQLKKEEMEEMQSSEFKPAVASTPLN